MAGTNNLLILSNGHGEDAMGALLGKRLQEMGIPVSAFPLVGEGAAYCSADLPLVGVQGIMPSGGFILEGTSALWEDIKAGLLDLTWRQIQALRRMRHEFSWAIGVGDVFPLAMNALFLKLPFAFIPTAKSDYIRPHFTWETALMRRHCRLVFPRDSKTGASLSSQGVPAEYLGNMMMDAVRVTGEDFSINKGRNVIGILPGSREPEAYANAAQILDIVLRITSDMAEEEPVFLLALAGGLSQTRLAAATREAGWSWKPPNADEGERGVCGRLQHRSGVVVLLVRGRFGDVLAQSTVVIGMSGTGNEQAAGLGVPVIAPPGRGPQFTRHFALDQQRLLGDAVMVIEDGPAAVAAAVWVLLRDAQQRERMQKVGRERMGEPGAIDRMANRIIEVMGV